LQNHGINISDINKLKSSGICTIKVYYILNRKSLTNDIKAIQMTTKRNLAKIKGISETKVDKIKEVVCTMMVNI
jgi:meiotic recombination protein DMC1